MGLPKPVPGDHFHTIPSFRGADRRALPYPGRVLLVSHHPDERGMYGGYLRSHGFCVLESQSAADAFRLASQVWLSVVIADARPREGDDPLDLTQLHDCATARGIPVVHLAASAAPIARGETGQASPDILLSTLCLPNVLVEVIRSLIRSSPRGGRALDAE